MIVAEHSDLLNQNENFDSKMSYLGHFFYFSSLFVLNNPFIFIETGYRFITFLSIMTFGVTLILFFEQKNSKIENARVLFLFFFFIISALRINTVGSQAGTTNQTQVFQASVTIITIFYSWIIASRINIKKMNISLLIISMLCFIPIFINSENIFDYNQRESFSLGVLNYDSYQSTSQIIGIFAITLTAYTISQKRNILTYAISFLIVGLTLYTITLSPARGEAIAIIAALLVLFISGNKWNIILLAFFGVFFATQNFLESTLGSRLSSVASGDFGERDYLFSLAISQFFGRFKTFFFGDGLNGYQYHNTLPVELYPHNFILEGAVSGGIGFFTILVITFIFPIFKMFVKKGRSPEESLTLCLMVFLILINMKSGTLISLWGLGAYTALFIRVPNKDAANQK